MNFFLTYLVEVKFKFLQNILHYYNNMFAFHMHMFTIFVLSLNKLNTTIHSNIRFMIIAYN
jgi:F0F1-type ATP synthase delta subunit